MCIGRDLKFRLKHLKLGRPGDYKATPHSKIIVDTDALKVLDEAPLKVATATGLYGRVNQTLHSNREVRQKSLQ